MKEQLRSSSTAAEAQPEGMQGDTLFLGFRAVERRVETNVVDNDEREQRGGEYVSWGSGNDYPEYCDELVHSVPTLGSVVRGCIDYIAGDEVRCAVPLQNGNMNLRGDDAETVVRHLAEQVVTYGGLAIQRIERALRSDLPAEIYVEPMRYYRTDKDNQRFMYSEDWVKKYARKGRMTVYPKWVRDGDAPTSVIWAKYNGHGTYPAPLYEAAVKDCEIERQISEYHLNSIVNGFSGSYLVNMNNGRPTPEQKEELERMFNEKFTGAQNAGRVMLQFNASKDNEATIQKLEVDDWGEKYQSLAAFSRQQIFTAFRANPVLFGLPSESAGFNNSADEYENAWRLFNRTFVRPIQKFIVRTLNDIWGQDAWSIVPFSIEGREEAVSE